jgi:predicted ferric reductase
MAILLLSSAVSVRRRAYEVFHTLHLILAVAIVPAIYIHSKSKELIVPPTIYLLIVICLQTSMGILRLGQVLYRNVKKWKTMSRATVQTIIFKRDSDRDIPVSDTVHVRVQLARPWEHRAGQYAYLCIPGVSHTSFSQSHPFYVF